MPSQLTAGERMPEFSLPLVGGGDVAIGKNLKADRFTLFVTYRGIHCPLCKKYNSKLEESLDDLDKLGVDVVFASMNNKEQAEKAVQEWGLKSKVAYGLSESQAKSLGLYVSTGMESFGEPEAFSEPGCFAINSEGSLQFVDVSNAPFLRPDIEHMILGMNYAIGKGYPIRGTRG